MQITPIPIYQDNYVWVLHHEKDAWVVDPGLAAPVNEHLLRHGLTLKGLLITHNHWDHVTGIPELVATHDVPVFGPAIGDIPCISSPLQEGDTLNIFDRTFTVLCLPGHTFDHIAYYSAEPHPIIFNGDTLFSCGCGRLYTGTMEQHHDSLKRLTTLPPETRIYCTHEYTLDNIRFAKTVEPNNTELIALETRVRRDRADEKPSLPTTLTQELKTNPFLRCLNSRTQHAIRESVSSAFHQSSAQENADSSYDNTDGGDDNTGKGYDNNATSLELFTALRQWKDRFV